MELRARYERMSDDELLGIALLRPDDFTPEAVDTAKAVLGARGIDVAAEAEAVALAHLAVAEAELAHEREVRAVLDSFTVAARAPGRCLACQQRPPVEEAKVDALPPTAEQAPGMPIPAVRVAVPLIVPLCERCAPSLRVWVLPEWAWIASLILGCAASFAVLFSASLWARSALGVDPEPLTKLLAALTLVGGAGLAAIPTALTLRAVKRVAALHPRHAELAEAGFRFAPPR